MGSKSNLSPPAAGGPSNIGYKGPVLKTLLIVFHSLTGGTRQMAEAAATGAASEPEVTVRLLTAGDAEPDDVLAADGYIFAAPENLAAMAGRMKDFFDRTYYAAFDRNQWPPVRRPDLCRQRRRERRSTNCSHRYRLAPACGRGRNHRLHVCTIAGRDPGAENHLVRRSRSLPRLGRGSGQRPGGRHFLKIAM